MTTPQRFEKRGEFYKVSGGIAYGWAFVSTVDGVPYFDLGDGKHSDHIPEDCIEEVAATFMRESGAGLDMHKGERVADVLYAYPMTAAIKSGTGLSGRNTGLLIGWQPYDKAILEKIASGERIGFSIGGSVTEWDIVDAQGNVVETVSVKGRVGVAIGKSVDANVGKQLRRVFRTWKLDEVSLVDRPMQEPALVGVVKSAAKKRTLARVVKSSAVITSLVDGHQHALYLDCLDDGAGRTSYETSAGAEWGHDHAFVVNPDGTITVAANDGHSHTAARPKLPDGAPAGATTVEMRAADTDENPGEPARERVGKLREPITAGSVPSMADDTKIFEQQITSLTKRAERAEKMAELSDAHRAFAKSLPEAERDAFAAKSAAEREALVKASIAYTATDGTVYFAHEDARMIKSVKDADELRKTVVLEKSLRQDAEFAKAAADDMGAYPESDAVHVAIIKAVEGIADEATRKAARAAIAAGNQAFGKATRTTGTSGAVEARLGGDELAKAESELKVAVEAYQKANNLSDYSVAFAKATGDDPATRAAYEKVAGIRAAAN